MRSPQVLVVSSLEGDAAVSYCLWCWCGNCRHSCLPLARAAAWGDLLEWAVTTAPVDTFIIVGRVWRDHHGHTEQIAGSAANQKLRVAPSTAEQGCLVWTIKAFNSAPPICRLMYRKWVARSFYLASQLASQLELVVDRGARWVCWGSVRWLRVRTVVASKPGVAIHCRWFRMASDSRLHFLFELIRPGCPVTKAYYRALELVVLHFITFDVERGAKEHYLLVQYLPPLALYSSARFWAKWYDVDRRPTLTLECIRAGSYLCSCGRTRQRDRLAILETGWGNDWMHQVDPSMSLLSATLDHHLQV